jgi:hypothetical protein
MWEIKENYGYGHRDEVEEAYQQGCEDGYRKAMSEMGHRDSGYGMRGDSGYGMRGGYGMRENYDDMGERRRRDSRGRYM